MTDFILESAFVVLIIAPSEFTGLPSDAVQILLGLAICAFLVSVAARSAYLDAKRRQHWPGKKKSN